jgi:hypothetical protein
MRLAFHCEAKSFKKLSYPSGRAEHHQPSVRVAVSIGGNVGALRRDQYQQLSIFFKKVADGGREIQKVAVGDMHQDRGENDAIVFSSNGRRQLPGECSPKQSSFELGMRRQGTRAHFTARLHRVNVYAESQQTGSVASGPGADVKDTVAWLEDQGEIIGYPPGDGLVAAGHLLCVSIVVQNGVVVRLASSSKEYSPSHYAQALFACPWQAPKPLDRHARHGEISPVMEFKRIFTRREAESTLPLVRQIVSPGITLSRKAFRDVGPWQRRLLSSERPPILPRWLRDSL